MQLKSFRVRNYRSINDSGPIDVAKITSLVGRNESGKSNLLQALQSLSPPGGRKPLVPIKDFPRDRNLKECLDTTPFLETTWDLSEEEREEIRMVLPQAQSVKEARISRDYKGTPLYVLLPQVRRPSPEIKEIRSAIKRSDALITTSISGLPADHQTGAAQAWTSCQAALESINDVKAWAAGAVNAIKDLRGAFAKAAAALPDAAEIILEPVEELAESVTAFDANHQKAISLVAGWVPLFVYVAEFPEVNGKVVLSEFVSRKQNPASMTDADKNFEKLAKVAGLEPQQLQSLLSKNDAETRNQLVNRAGAIVTSTLRKLWKDRQLKVRFNLDGQNLDTLISDPNNAYDVEVNLNERSRGLRWFFSFYVTFAADTDGGDADGAVLLLDEPGLYLHASSQHDLLKHLRGSFTNQILYTTHSPFMVPADAIQLVRTVNIAADTGTTVTNNPTGDSRTLFPLQAALGYTLSQSLFVGSANLIVEGVTDFWILSAARAHLEGEGASPLPGELVLTPADGAQKVSYMVALLTSQELDVLVLLDDEKAGQLAKDELLRSKLIRESNVLLVSEAFDPPPAEADVEDLIDQSVYEELVRETYKKELRGKKLIFNDKIPRIVKRVEAGFADLGIEFHKTRPARLFMTRMGTQPEAVLTADSRARFERLFARISERFLKHQTAGRNPFH